MKKIQHENIRSISVKQDALDDIYAHFDEFHRTTVFQEECRSWFKDGKVKNRIYLWPGCVSASTTPISAALAFLPSCRFPSPSPSPSLFTVTLQACSCTESLSHHTIFQSRSNRQHRLEPRFLDTERGLTV
jgi:hypothetical protein